MTLVHTAVLTTGLLPSPRCLKIVSNERASEQMRTRFLEVKRPLIHAHVGFAED
jgi:hypothetical protein